MSLQLLLQFICLVWLIDPSIAAAPSLAKPGCAAVCGKVSIPYPFGIGEGCYQNEWYEITCNTSFSPKRPFLSKFNLEMLEVSKKKKMLEVSLQDQLVKLNIPIASNCPQQSGVSSMWTSSSFKGSPFNISRQKNEFTVVGCENALLTYKGEIMAGCTSTCNSNTSTTKACYGVNCCQTSIPIDLDIYRINISGSTTRSRNCTSAFLVDQDWFRGKVSNPYVINNMEHTPVTMTWTITDLGKVKKKDDHSSAYKCNQGPYYYCQCEWAHEGNPYIFEGCKVVEACAGCDKECAMLKGEFYCNKIDKRGKIISKVPNFKFVL